ncbi:MAG: pitrilysin family protein [Deltaproteobacteria bacterium]|jgi:predicted Zn-dependent peptidase|nr:insulinase family protein [Deltaproteobacteria bacterium]MCL5880884.1 insulinase family protein [Deltaproteobacteria bacterium]MDA8303733.1 pitrilysin family protein [Deltaproteobacteria bacterium]
MRNFQKEELKSGITLITEKKSYFNSVSIGLWVKTGSAYEPANLNGISHFIEHLLFKGTKTRTYKDINKEIDLMGGALNAFTGTELTCLYTRVLSENYDNAISLLIDLMFNSLFPPDEVNKEKGVILQEISGVQDDPFDYSMELFHKNFYGNSSFAYPILGTEETVNNLDRKKILDYFYLNYNPRNVVISVAGNFDHGEIVKCIDRYMDAASVNGGKSILPDKPGTNKKYGEFFQEKNLEQTHFIIGLDGIKKTDENYYALEVLNTLLGGSVSSRLFQEVRENKGLAYSIYSNAAFHKFDGYVYIYAGVSPKKFELSKNLIFDIIDSLAQDNISDEEILNAKRHISDSFLLGMESTSYIMNNNAINEIYHNRYISKTQILKKIDSVDRQAIRRVAKQLFSAKANRNISVLGRVE